MTTEKANIWVKEGDKFAGGILTKNGAAEVNGHRDRVLKGEPPLHKKVVQNLAKHGTPAHELIEIEDALQSTEW